MLSNKLTFSLASLIVLLMIGLCLPVDAQQVSKLESVVLPAPTTTVVPAPFVATDGTVTAGTATAGFVGHTFYVYGKAANVGAAGIATGVNYAPAVAADPSIALPDLEEFFRLGGTVELIAMNSLGLVAKDAAISEIMWALDIDSDSASDDTRRQWIEIFFTKSTGTLDAPASAGTAPTAIAAGDLKFLFFPFVHPNRVGSRIDGAANDYALKADGMYRVIDSVSNLQYIRWNLHGENGNTVLPRTTHAASDPPVKPLVSMYRNIDYMKIKGRHKLDDGDNRTEQLKGVPDGILPGSWKATPAQGIRNTVPIVGRTDLIAATPGAEHVEDVVYAGVTKTSIASDSVVINEVRNDNSPANIDWVELYNAGTEPVGLRDWELSVISGDSGEKTDKMLVGKEDGQNDDYRFPPNDVFKLQPKTYLLIVNRHPGFTPLANGVNIEEVAAGEEVKAGAMHQYIVREKLDLPNAGITLILRNALDKNSHHKGDNKKWDMSLAPSEKIMDYAGSVSIAAHTNEYNTLVWPFRGWTKTAGTDGKDGEGIPNNATQAHARKRYQANDGHHKDAWDQVGAKGGLGYDPGVDLRYAPGTPGYANNAVMTQLVDDKDTSTTTDDVLFAGSISISEVMVDAGPRWNLVQWIELYNDSMTEAINLKDWELEIRNATDEVESYVDSSFVFTDAYILPNQTLLLVSGQAVNDVADNRVYNLFQHHRRQLGLTNRRSVLLSPSGFYLKLTDKNGDMVDEAGNVMVKGAARTVVWELPARSDDMRRSIVRQYGSRELYDGSADPADDGTMMESWRQSDVVGAGISFYGHRDDVGTPGYRLGGPLPVSLSKFRPVRNQESGHVDITWITESELNNAGFNILRAESKNGEYKVINVKGIIAGNGTTSEQHVYKFTDTTAKPNVVYYYQIEDVSINGMRTTLTTTHLRGHVGAAGKLTTTWGDLKLQK